MPSYFITGANRGLGFEFVKQLSAAPENVVFTLVRSKANSANLLELQNKTGNVHVLEGDITDTASLKSAAEEVKKVTGGTLNVLINNAALIGDNRSPWNLEAFFNDPNEKLLEEDINTAVRINAVSVAHTINTFLPLLRTAAVTSTSRIVAISSGLADPDANSRGQFEWAVPYCVSKAALNMLIAKFAASLHEENIVVLSVSPGFVNTAEKPPPPEQLPFLGQMMTAFKKAFPSWNSVPAAPVDSVTAMLDVINKAEKKDSGAWVSHKGNKEWL